MPSSLVPDYDHSPCSSRKFSFRDFVRYYPWALANGLVPSLPPAGLELLLDPFKGQWPDGSMLYPGVDYATSLSSLFNFQFRLNAGDWEFHFILERADPLIYKETFTATPYSILRLFAARVPVFAGVWLFGFVVNGSGISLTIMPNESGFSHFLIHGAVSQENPQHNLDLVSYSVLHPTVVVPHVFS
jgi:hypothetical protein